MANFNIKEIKISFLATAIILLLSIGNNLDAQRFKGSAVFGLNFAQIDGDALYGYSKLGWTGGMKLGYPLKDKIDLNMEMLYSQRGSTSGFGFGNSNDIFTDLQYISIPLYIDYKDWFIEDDKYYKVGAHLGLSTAYLFAVESSNGTFSNDIENYERISVSYLLGVDYAFNKRLGMTLRYTRAVHSLYTVTAIGYFVTLRTEYKF